MLTHLPQEQRGAAKERLKDVQALRAPDIASAILYMVAQPRHVAVSEMLVQPTESLLWRPCCRGGRAQLPLAGDAVASPAVLAAAQPLATNAPCRKIDVRRSARSAGLTSPSARNQKIVQLSRLSRARRSSFEEMSARMAPAC